MKRFFFSGLLMLLWLLVTEYSSAASSKCYYDETPQSFASRSVFTPSLSNQSLYSRAPDSIDCFVREQGNHLFYDYDSPTDSVLGNIAGNHFSRYDSATGVWDYVVQNPWTMFDPDGLSAWSAGFKILKNGGNIAGAFAGAKSHFSAAYESDNFLGTFGHIWAGLSEVLPVSVSDVEGMISSGQSGADAAQAAVDGDFSGALEIGKGALKDKALKKALGQKKKGKKRGSECFAKGTLVATPMGNLPIEELNIGDSVFAYDFEKAAIVVEKIIETPRNWTDIWVNISIGDDIFVSTRFHRFWLESSNEWEYAINLKKGDVVRSFDGTLKKIGSVQIQSTAANSTFNLEVSNQHNYFVGHEMVLVHNGEDKEGNKVNGNSKKNNLPHSTYNLRDSQVVNQITNEPDIVKNGIADGSSDRIKTQVDIYEKKEGVKGRYYGETTRTNVQGTTDKTAREIALEKEKGDAKANKKAGNTMRKHKRPKC